MTTQPQQAPAAGSVERARVLRRLRQAGFTDKQAWALASSGPNTVFVVPLGDAR